jgi:WD40 repeat protein
MMTDRTFRRFAVAIGIVLGFAAAAGAQGRPDIAWMRGGHLTYITRLVYASDGSFFISAATDNTVKIWRGSDAVLLRTIIIPRGSFAMALSPDNSTVCAGGQFPDGSLMLRCWGVADGVERWTSTVPNTCPGVDRVLKVAFSSDGQRVATTACGVFIWRASDGTLLSDFSGSPAGLWRGGGLGYSPDGRFIGVTVATYPTADNPRLGLIDPTSGSLLWDYGSGSTSFGYDVAFSPDSQLVAASNGTGTHVFYTSSDHSELPWSKGATAVDVNFSPDGAHLASGGNGAVNLWNALTGAIVRMWTGHTYGVTNTPVAFTADSSELLTAQLDIKRWKSSDGSAGSPADNRVTAQVGPISTLAISANEAVVATIGTPVSGSADIKTISLFRTSDGALLRYIDFGPMGLAGLALSPDGKHVVGADHDQLRIWNVATGKLEHTHAVSGRSSNYLPVAYSPDGTAIAFSGDDRFLDVNLWHPATDTVTMISGGPASALQFLPDGRLVINQLDPSSNLVRVVTMAGHIDRQWPSVTAGPGLTVSADGSMVAEAGGDNAFPPGYIGRVWRVSDGATVQTFVGHTNTVRSIAFAYDGQTVITGSEDATVRIWRVADGAQLHLYDTETYTNKPGYAYNGVYSLVASTRSAKFIYGRADATTVTAYNPEAQPQILSFTLPVKVTGCKPAAAKITLDRPAPPAGLTIALTSASGDVLPANVTFTAGLRTKSVSLKTAAVAASETVGVTATLGSQTANASVALRPIGLAALTLAATAVTGGTSVEGGFTLECAAGPDDVVVTLSSSIPSAAQPTPATLTIPHGSLAGKFTVTTSTVTATKKPAIKGKTTPDALMKSKVLTVNP